MTKSDADPPKSNQAGRAIGAIICAGEKLFGESFAEALSDHGATVTVARNTAAALDALRVELPGHVVIAIFPHGDGALDLLRRCGREASGVRLFLVTFAAVSAVQSAGEPDKGTGITTSPRKMRG